MTTSIIIPSMNSLKLLKECILSIRRHTGSPYELVVVDNGSQDGSLSYCRRENIVVVSRSSHEGDASAYNMGLKIASGDSMVLMNPGVLVARNWLSNMLHCLNSHEDIGITGPLSNIVEEGRYRPFVGYNARDLVYRANVPDSGKWVLANRMPDFCCLLKREVVERIGYFAEQDKDGCDVNEDFCERARRAGYRIMIAGDVFVYHRGNQIADPALPRSKQPFHHSLGGGSQAIL